MFNDKLRTATTVPQITRNGDAIFVGWQKTSSGEVFALYSIIAAGHPSLGSTVTDITLQRLNLQVPSAPPPRGPVKKF
jgi:hypothetical protein